MPRALPAMLPPRWRPIAVYSIPKRSQQAERLREVARGHLHLVALLTQALDHRTQDEHVRAVGEVDPDAHGASSKHRGRACRPLSEISRWVRAGRGRRQVSFDAMHLVIASISGALVNEISHFIREAGLPGIFALMAISAACIPIPSEVVMLFAGFAVADPASSGSSHHLTLLGIVLAGVAGSMVGSWIAYGVGRGGRLELLERHGAKMKWIPPTLARSNARTAGSRAMAAGQSCSGRLVPFVRAFVSLPAGVSKMPLVRFSVLSLIGTVPWVLGLALAGEAVGSDWTKIRTGFEYVDYAIVALIVAGVVWSLWRRRGVRRGTAVATEPEVTQQRHERRLRRCAVRSCSACCRGRPRWRRSPPLLTRPCFSGCLGPSSQDPSYAKSFEVALHGGTALALALADGRQAAATAGCAPRGCGRAGAGARLAALV